MKLSKKEPLKKAKNPYFLDPTIQLLTDDSIDWEKVKRNRRNLARVNLIGRKSLVFFLGVGFLIFFVIMSFVFIEQILLVAQLAAYIMAAYTALSGTFLFATYYDKKIEGPVAFDKGEENEKEWDGEEDPNPFKNNSKY